MSSSVHTAEERRQLGVVRPSHHEEATQHSTLNFKAYEAPVLPSQRAASAALGGAMGGAPPPSGVSPAFPGEAAVTRLSSSSSPSGVRVRDSIANC